MSYPIRFERMSESLPPLPAVAKQLAELRDNLRRAGVPECFWRYDMPKDPRLDGIRAYNRGVDHWNRMNADEQRRVDRIGHRD